MASTSYSAPPPAAAPPSPRRTMIQKFIEELQKQGFLDDVFNQRRTQSGNQGSLGRFVHDSEPKLEIVKKALNDGNVDFRTAIATAEMIKTAAERVGGPRVQAACDDLQKQCNENNIAGSKEAYKRLDWEYYILRDVFHHILQAERTMEI